MEIQYFFEIFFGTITFIIITLFIYLVVFKKSAKTKPGCYCRTLKDPEITFIPKGNPIYKEAEISRMDEIISIPPSSRFEFNGSHTLAGEVVGFKGVILIAIQNPNRLVLSKYFEMLISDKKKKPELSDQEMEKLIIRAINSTFHFGDRQVFPYFLKDEIAHNTCFHVNDVCLESFHLCLN